MAVTTQQPNKRGSGGESALDRAAAWARPHDPRSNTRPPGNGDIDARDTRLCEERPFAVLGRQTGEEHTGGRAAQTRALSPRAHPALAHARRASARRVRIARLHD